MEILNDKEILALTKFEIESIINLLVLIQDAYINNEITIDIDSLLSLPITSLIEINKTLSKLQ